MFLIQESDQLMSAKVVRSYPKCDIPKDIKDLDAKQEWWHKEWDTKRELLHRGQFYRIGK